MLEGFNSITRPSNIITRVSIVQLTGLRCPLDMDVAYMTLKSKSRLRALRGLRDGLPSIYIHTYIHTYHCKYCFTSESIYNRFILDFIFKCTFLGWIRFNRNLGNFGLISIFIFSTCLVMGWDRFRSPSSENKCCSFSHRSHPIPDHMAWNYWYIFGSFNKLI